MGNEVPLNEIYGIHIMTAGSGINETFHKVLRSSQFRLDEVHVLADKTIFSANSTKTKLNSIKKSIVTLQNYCKEYDITHKLIQLDSVTIDLIIEKVIEISKSIPESINPENIRYYSNITGGTKIASIGLFLGSIWIGALPYYVYEEQKEPIIFKIPKLNPLDLTKNKNYILILSELNKKPLRNTDLKIKIQKKYEAKRPKRSSGELTPGNLSKMLWKLEGWGLIRIEKGKSRRENLNTITNEGRLMLNLLRK